MIGPMTGLGVLLIALASFTAFASPLIHFMNDSAMQNLDISNYIDSVLVEQGK